ncbi:MAG: PAS domain S-box protein, partial [Desulfomonile sp.]
MPPDTNHGNFSDHLSMYEDLLANIPTAIYRFRVTASGGWRFDFVNRAFCELTGLDREDIFDDYETVFRLIHPDELDSFISLNKSAQKTNTPFDWEGRGIVHGENRWIRVQSSPTPMDNGEVVWSGYFVDITDSKRAEEDRRLLQENLEQLVEERTANLRKNEQKLRTINDSALDAIILINDKGEIFSWNPASERLFGYSSSEVMGKNVHELLALAEYRPAYRSAFKDFVLTGHGNAVGRITELVALRKDGKPFPIELSLSSFQMDGRWHASGIVRDISERKRAEEKLQDEKDKLKNILDHMIDGVYILNSNYDIEYINPCLKAERGDIAGRKCFEYLASLNAPCPWCKNRQVFDGESLTWERTSSSTGKTYDIFETPIRNTDGSISKLSILHDITKRKEAEASLRENSAFLRTLMNAIPAPIFYKDTDGHYMGFNKSFEDFFGKKEQELVGKSVFDMYPREFAEIFHAKDQELLNNHGVQVYESQITDAGAVVHDVVFHKSTFSNSQGNVIGLLGVILDITERKRSENTLRENERFLRQSEKIARTGGWKANPFTDRLYWTEGVYDICEAPKDYQPGLDEGLEFYTPPYRPILKEAVVNTIEQGEPFAIEAEVITTTGKHLWTEVRGLMRVEDGEEPQVIGSFQDITERKLAESDLRRLSTAIEQAAEAVIITDARGVIQYVNHAQEILSGYGIHELVGQMPNVLNSDFHEANFHEQIWDTIGVGKAWSGRFINRKKDGNEYHQDATISPIFDKSGNLTNFIVVQHDVTKQVELQEQLFQAQKMEAIGTLAGGFAHDFNNKLQVIAGYVELMLCNEELPENLKHDMDAIGQAVHAGAELIKGMMVFSRKTPIELQTIDLNKLVAQTGSMLARSISKMIEIDLLLADDLWTIKAAPNQIDQILMNLAVNARDAMPDGG